MGFRLYNTDKGIYIAFNQRWYTTGERDWDSFTHHDDLYDRLHAYIASMPPVQLDVIPPLRPPIGHQEVWAAGVTYYRSREARMDEAAEAGGDRFYQQVYDASRPELFFKATAARTVGHLDTVRIRTDSYWDVPEPELALFITANQRIVGYTIGNDMSSRSIEGENPLYLPQAKMYDGSTSIGPCLYVPEKPMPNRQKSSYA